MPIVGTVFSSSQNMSISMLLFAAPGVWLSPCSDGYWPVRIDVRLGTQAEVMM